MSEGYDIRFKQDYATVTIKMRDELSPWEPRDRRKRLPRKTKKRLTRYFRAAVHKQYKSMAKSLVAAWWAGL